MNRFRTADLSFDFGRQRSGQERIARIDALATLLDTAFVIPGTQIRFGLDALIGLVPGIGDAITTVMSLFIVNEARALGAPALLIARMRECGVRRGVPRQSPQHGAAARASRQAGRARSAVLGARLMGTPVTVSVPHRLGKDEATRRLKSGLTRMRGNLSALVAIEQEVWTGDTLQFHMRALGQSAAGTIEVLDESLRIEVTLPWLLAKLSERLLPAIKKEATLLLEHK